MVVPSGSPLIDWVARWVNQSAPEISRRRGPTKPANAISPARLGDGKVPMSAAPPLATAMPRKPPEVSEPLRRVGRSSGGGVGGEGAATPGSGGGTEGTPLDGSTVQARMSAVAAASDAH